MNVKKIRATIKMATEALAKILGDPKVTDLEVVEAMQISRTYEKLFNEDAEVCKKKIIPLLKQAGKIQEGKKSTVLSFHGWKLSMYPRVGLDPKKVMARIVAKKGPTSIQDYMVMVPTYELDQEGGEKDKKLKKLFTEAELKDMKYDESWTVATPTEE